MKRGGKIRAGIPLDQNRTYSKSLVAQIKHRYLTHLVLAYHRTKAAIMETLAVEFGLTAIKVRNLLQYEKML